MSTDCRVHKRPIGPLIAVRNLTLEKPTLTQEIQSRPIYPCEFTG